ncbi:hypothetical protein THAOC_30425, partial [Thalassiosira oceanica]
MLHHQQNRQNDRGPDEATTEGLGPWNRVASGPESSSTESSDLAMVFGARAASHDRDPNSTDPWVANILTLDESKTDSSLPPKQQLVMRDYQ